MAIKDDVTPKFSEDKAFTITTPSPSGGGHPQAVAFTQNQIGDVLTGEVCPSMGTNQNATGRNTPKVQAGMSVRRLTPRECERLQGFPDDYTLIPTRPVPAKGQEAARRQAEGGDERFRDIGGVMYVVAADGPRYKALGNSMCAGYDDAHPGVMRWLGERIQAVDEILREAK